MSKRYRSYVSLTITILLVLVSVVLVTPAHASTASELKQRINDLTNKTNSKKQEVNQTNEKLKKNQSQQQSVQGKLNAIKIEIESASAQITSKQKSIQDTKTSIDQLNKQIADVKERIKRRDVLLKERVKAMYVTGSSTDYLQVLLNSSSFGNFVSRAVALTTIANQDQRILDQQKADKQQLDTQQGEVKSELVSLQNDMKDLKSLQASLSSKQAEQQKLMADLKSQQKDLEQEKFSAQEIADNLSSQKAAAQKAYDLWKADEAKKAEEAKQAAQSSSNSSSSGSSSSSSSTPSSATSNATSSHSNSGAILAWPVAGGYITSPYGPRAFDHEFHPGIDIGKGMGAPIMAAADGVVNRAYVSSSYGNCVMITHYINGQEYTTVYAHMERYVVSTGQVVRQGQVIGYMGDSGEATGPHLHFEVYRGPWNPPPHPGTINPVSVLP